MNSAALYLRSSKDRADVSIDAQRRQLKELALSRGLTIAAEFADAVESGKDEQRPGFQAMLAAVRKPDRGWSTILVLDTSRLSRRRVTAMVFEEDICKRAGVVVLFKSVPDVDPITEMILKAVLQAFDQMHSMVSRAKGLAGMAENVRAGYRAGGRAPYGYRLQRHETGTMREGEPVTKTSLELAPTARKLRKYLRARAEGIQRQVAADAAGLDLNSTSLVGIEWNALTYAGHTVWNVHRERLPNGKGYVGGKRRRPRAEWLVQRGTHKALISDAAAEAILVRLEAYSTRTTRRTKAENLLSGLLRTPAGAAWHADGQDAYRVPGRRVKRQEIESAVTTAVLEDIQSPAFVRRLTATSKANAPKLEDPAAELRPKVAEIEKRIRRMMELAAQMSETGPALREVEVLERDRADLVREIADLEADYRMAMAMSQVSEHHVRRRIVEIAKDLDTDNRDSVKDTLRLLVDRITLDPVDLDSCTIHYRIGGDKVASPQESEPIPELRMAQRLAWRR